MSISMERPSCLSTFASDLSDRECASAAVHGSISGGRLKHRHDGVGGRQSYLRTTNTTATYLLLARDPKIECIFRTVLIETASCARIFRNRPMRRAVFRIRTPSPSPCHRFVIRIRRRIFIESICRTHVMDIARSGTQNEAILSTPATSNAITDGPRKSY